MLTGMRNILFISAALLVVCDAQLPDGVSICDDSEPVGTGKAFLLREPIPYCMNGGICKRNYEANPLEPCICSDKYEGPHCEFNKGTAPECSLHCFSGGTCQTGAKSFELVLNEFQAPEDLQYCLCPQGRSGITCEKESQSCGDGYCMNGGTCVAMDQADGSETFHCDCTTAYTGTAAYAGEFCEHKATVFCSSDHNGRNFCTNGGACKDNSYMGCKCPDGFTGPVCEFKVVDIEYYDCNLECQNNGICRKGAKDVSFLEKFGLHRRELLGQRFNADFEHCVCPKGYAGMTCEYEMEVCPGRQYVCMHGGECEIYVKEGEAGIQCNCEDAHTSRNRYEGQYCEMRSTSFCTTDGSMTSDGPGYNAFCTNEGVCVDSVQPGHDHPGCYCEPGFDGDHCEYGEPEEKSPVGLIVGLSVAAAVLALLVCCIMYRRKKRNRLMMLRRTYGKSYKDSPPPPTLEHIGSLEPWMQSRVNLHDMAERMPEDDDADDVSGGSVSSLAPSDVPPITNRVSQTAMVFTEGSGAASLMKGDRSSMSGSSETRSDYSVTTADFGHSALVPI